MGESTLSTFLKNTSPNASDIKKYCDDVKKEIDAQLPCGGNSIQNQSSLIGRLLGGVFKGTPFGNLNIILRTLGLATGILLAVYLHPVLLIACGINLAPLLSAVAGVSVFGAFLYMGARAQKRNDDVVTKESVHLSYTRNALKIVSDELFRLSIRPDKNKNIRRAKTNLDAWTSEFNNGITSRKVTRTAIHDSDDSAEMKVAKIYADREAGDKDYCWSAMPWNLNKNDLHKEVGKTKEIVGALLDKSVPENVREIIDEQLQNAKTKCPEKNEGMSIKGMYMSRFGYIAGEALYAKSPSAAKATAAAAAAADAATAAKAIDIQRIVRGLQTRIVVANDKRVAKEATKEAPLESTGLEWYKEIFSDVTGKVVARIATGYAAAGDADTDAADAAFDKAFDATEEEGGLDLDEYLKGRRVF